MTTAVVRLVISHLECLSSLSSADTLCRKLEDLQQFQKKEPENEEEVDILNLSEPVQTNIKKEQEEKQEELKLYLPPTPGSEFIGDITQKVGAVACGAARSQASARCSDIQPHELAADFLRGVNVICFCLINLGSASHTRALGQDISYMWKGCLSNMELKQRQPDSFLFSSFFPVCLTRNIFLS